MSRLKIKFAASIAFVLSSCSHEIEVSEHNWQSYNTQPSIAAETTELSHLIFFDTDSDDIGGSELESLLSFAHGVGEAATFHIRIEGHADARASEEYNLDLSIRRAQSVADAIKGLGTREPTIGLVGYGEGQPTSLGRSSADLAQNRRVEIVAQTVSLTLQGCSGQDPTRLRPTSNEANASLGCSNLQNFMASIEDKSDLLPNTSLQRAPTIARNGPTVFGSVDRFRNRESVELPDAGTIQ